VSIQSINPTTGSLIKNYREMSPKKVDIILKRAHHAFELWRLINLKDRSVKLKKAAEILRNKKDQLSRLMALEMGKPLGQGREEIEKCAWNCEFYAANAQQFLAQQRIETDASKSFVSFEPLGVVLAIMPWNYPFWQVFRFLAPALIAGNGAVLKHASNVPGCALAIEQIIRQAGFPRNLFRTLLINSEEASRIIESPYIKAVTLTGSTQAGKAVAAKAGSCLKKTVLELGGSDPYLILSDADLEDAVEECVDSRLRNSGQSCVAAKRFIVPKTIKKQVEELFIAKMQAKKLGPPEDETTDIGPLARRELRDQLHKQVTISIKKGARLLLGGKIPSLKGAFYPPTILTNVRKGMPAYEEELFGPVASIITARNEREAVRIANDTIYGLGASIFTKNIIHGENIAVQNLEAGCCFVNASVASDPRLPFGGIKGSGYGRELSSFGIREFVNIKTIYMK
jgi:succinate-semialdehyde dehydrogenase/glutarate-semialdehyde dehydrogenase